MDLPQSPLTWKAPIWHPDFGDPVGEVEHLKSFAVKLLEILPEATVALEIPEPGLMFCRVESKRGSTAEVYSITDFRQTDSRRYGVFTSPDTIEEGEEYTESAMLAVNYLRNHFGE